MEGIRNYIIFSQFALQLLYKSPGKKQIDKDKL